MAARWGKAVDSAAAISRAAADGFDCAAITAEYVMDGDDKQFMTQKDLFRQCRLAPEVCLSVLPTGAGVTAKGFNLYYWLDYLERATRRLAELGCRALIWRSGTARNLPLEGDQDAMKEQAMQFVYMLCRLCEERGLAVMIEPLAADETNYLNTMSETEEFIGQIKKHNLHVAVSMDAAAELMGGMPLAAVASRVRHVCVKDAAAAAEAPFLSALLAANYQGIITFIGDADKEILQRYRQLCD